MPSSVVYLDSGAYRSRRAVPNASSVWDQGPAETRNGSAVTATVPPVVRPGGPRHWDVGPCPPWRRRARLRWSAGTPAESRRISPTSLADRRATIAEEKVKPHD